jgi:hypothetical protein
VKIAEGLTELRVYNDLPVSSDEEDEKPDEEAKSLSQTIKKVLAQFRETHINA